MQGQEPATAQAGARGVGGGRRRSDIRGRRGVLDFAGARRRRAVAGLSGGGNELAAGGQLTATALVRAALGFGEGAVIVRSADDVGRDPAVGLGPRGAKVVHMGLVVQLALLDLRVERRSVRVRDEQQQEDAAHEENVLCGD